MPFDPVLLEDTRGWLPRPQADLGARRWDLVAAPPFLEDALFHFQQAVEKAEKAFLTWYDVPFRKTHDLQELAQQCSATDPSLAEVLERAADLSDYAWKLRYPDMPAYVDTEEAQRGLVLAQEILDAIRARLPAEVWPRPANSAQANPDCGG